MPRLKAGQTLRALVPQLKQRSIDLLILSGLYFRSAAHASACAETQIDDLYDGGDENVIQILAAILKTTAFIHLPHRHFSSPSILSLNTT